MMKNQRKAVIFLALSVFYVCGYAACRLTNELIHRKTWNGGWNRHRVEAATPEPRIQPLPFAPPHIHGDAGYNGAMAEYQAGYRAIAVRRKACEAVFFPLRWAESVVWLVVDPKDRNAP